MCCIHRAFSPGHPVTIPSLHADDVLVVWKLDRLERFLSFLIELIEKLQNDGVGFESISDGMGMLSRNGLFRTSAPV